MNDDHDVAFAATAFGAALPSIEYRPDARRAPRPPRRTPTALAATAAVVTAAVVTTVVLTGGGNTPAAWSATPKALSSSASTQMDRACRAATPLPPQGLAGTTHSGTARSGTTHVPRAVGRGAPARPGGASGSESGSIVGTGNVSGPATARAIGDLPLILIDARGSMALALYGDAEHHIICTLAPNGDAMITPDAGPWPSGDLIDSAATIARTRVAGDGSAASALQLLGTTASNVTAVAVDVPGAGSVAATVRNGHYALFVPDSLVHESDATSWPAHVTTSDGTVHDASIGAVNVTDHDGVTSMRIGDSH
jgi:hypothetical protein